MTLSSSHRRSIMRQCAAGVPASEIAAAFDISVHDVQRIDSAEQRKVLAYRRRVAEPIPGLKERDWKSARPAEERVRSGDCCRFPDCVSKVCRGSYCAEHGRLIYRPRAA